jgi:autophagy-related protein 13
LSKRTLGEVIRSMNYELEFSNLSSLWKQHAFSSSPAPPLIIETFLDISRLPPTSKLLLRNNANQRYERIGNDQLANVVDGSPSRKTSILLESWQMTLSSTSSPAKTELPIMYKKFIAFFRHLYG